MTSLTRNLLKSLLLLGISLGVTSFVLLSGGALAEGIKAFSLSQEVSQVQLFAYGVLAVIAYIVVPDLNDYFSTVSTEPSHS